MKIRFQCDADFNKEIIDGLRRFDPRIEIQASDEAGLRGVPDPRVLDIASREGRVLLTHDRRTMPSHFASFLKDKTCSGVIIVAQNVSVRTAIEELYLIWAVETSEDWINRICDVPY